VSSADFDYLSQDKTPCCRGVNAGAIEINPTLGGGGYHLTKLILVEEGMEEGPFIISSIDIQDRIRHLAKAFLVDTKYAKE